MAEIKFDIATINLVAELAKLGIGMVMNHRRANNQPLEKPVTVEEILELRIRDADELIESGIRGDA